MDIARGELGTREVPGPGSNPDVVSYYAEAGHPEIAEDETAWCAAYVGAMLTRAGYPNTGSLAARSYLSYGRKIAAPEPGCIVVFWRGSPTSWQGHVGFYVRHDGTHIRVLGGNQNNAVTEASYPKSQILGYRMPVAPTVRALQEAKSSEIPVANTLQKVAAGGATVGVGAELVTTVTGPAVPPPAPPVDLLKQTAEQVSLSKQVMEGANAVASLIVQHRWLLLVGVCIAAYVAGRWWKRNRVARAAAGQPIQSQTG
jgi:uncharacterized protein (TIGR02594 family)